MSDFKFVDEEEPTTEQIAESLGLQVVRDGGGRIEPVYPKSNVQQIKVTVWQNINTAIEKAVNADALRSKKAEASEILALNDQVMILVCNKDEVTEGGIIIPERAKKRPNEGIVIAVGPGSLDANNVFRPTSVQVGDRVTFEQYAGREEKIRGHICRVIREVEISLVMR